MELWKEIPGYAGEYLVSTDGRVKSLKPYGGTRERILKPTQLRKSRTSYASVSISSRGKVRTLTIHRAVAALFLPNPENKPFINHKDGDKYNPKLSNLEWCDPKENMQHAHRTGLMKNIRRGQVHHYAKLKDRDVRLITRSKLPSKELAVKLGVSSKTVRRVRNGSTWAHLTK